MIHSTVFFIISGQAFNSKITDYCPIVIFSSAVSVNIKCIKDEFVSIPATNAYWGCILFLSVYDACNENSSRTSGKGTSFTQSQINLIFILTQKPSISNKIQDATTIYSQDGIECLKVYTRCTLKVHPCAGIVKNTGVLSSTCFGNV